jgi:hypothetical protein
LAKPHIHALSSVRKYGGVVDDYLDIHEFLDSSKGTIADHRHRTLTHTTWFISTVLPRVFGFTRVNSAGKTYSVRDVGEDHVREDYGNRFIPTVQDFLADLPLAPWMQNGKGSPPSSAKLYREPRVTTEDLSNVTFD